MKSYSHFYFYLFLFFTSISTLSCDDDDDDDNGPIDRVTFTQIGLDGLRVYELVLFDDDSLFAATNDGIYAKDVDNNRPFERIGLEGRNVVDLIVFHPKHIIATTGIRGAIEDEPGIHETINGGSQWHRHNFGEGANGETAHSLSLHPTEKGTVYGTGNAVVAKSTDYGRNWEVIWGQWEAFASGTAVAEVNPSKTSDLWYGGQGGIENGYLGLLRDEQPVEQWDDLVDNPTVALELAFSGNEGQNILVGFEGAVMKTTNNGAEWTQVIDGHEGGIRFFYGIEHSKRRSQRVYAGGWLKGIKEQSLILFVSNDNGDTWEQYSFDSEMKGGIFSMTTDESDNRDNVFVGLDGGGVYEISVR